MESRNKNRGYENGEAAISQVPYHRLPDLNIHMINNVINGGGGGRVNSVSDDDYRLNQLGYKSELSRGLSALANFSVSFSIISVLTGVTTLFGTGLTYGGPVTMVYGWPIVGFFTFIVGLSLGEICSAYPTSAGLYFWSAKLSGEDWGPFASWLTGW